MAVDVLGLPAAVEDGVWGTSMARSSRCWEDGVFEAGRRGLTGSAVVDI